MSSTIDHHINRIMNHTNKGITRINSATSSYIKEHGKVPVELDSNIKSIVSNLKDVATDKNPSSNTIGFATIVDFANRVKNLLLEIISDIHAFVFGNETYRTPQRLYDMMAKTRSYSQLMKEFREYDITYGQLFDSMIPTQKINIVMSYISSSKTMSRERQSTMKKDFDEFRDDIVTAHNMFIDIIKSQAN